MSKCCESKNSPAKTVWENQSEDLVCYCFKHSKKELIEAIEQGLEQEFINQILKKIKNPGCFCETANPSGKCCLSDINDFIKNTKN